jgi:hypothetical protein
MLGDFIREIRAGGLARSSCPSTLKGAPRLSHGVIARTCVVGIACGGVAGIWFPPLRVDADQSSVAHWAQRAHAQRAAFRGESNAAAGWIAAIIMIGGIAGWLAEQFMKGTPSNKTVRRIL